MCFVNECDWYASICEESSAPCTRQITCDECHRPILVGQMKHSIYQQEHEECRECAAGFCDCLKDEDGDCLECKCENPNYGEIFEYVCCDDCHRFLKAVEAAEIDAGCAPQHSRPSLCGMIDEIGGGGREEGEKYFEKAQVMFPVLLASGYLNFLHNKIFHED